MSLTREQSKRKNYLNRVKLVQEMYEEQRQKFYDEWGWNPTKKKIWKKFVYPRFNIAYYTFIDHLQIDVDEELKNLESNIQNHKQQQQKMKKQINLFSILLALSMAITGCGIFSTLEGERYTDTELAQACADLYPCNDSLSVDTMYMDTTIWEIPEETIVYIDTTVCPPTDIPLTLIDTVEIVRAGKLIHIPVIRIDSTWYRRDSAAISALRLENQQLKKQMIWIPEQDKSDLPWWWLLFTAIGGFIVRHFIPRNNKNTQSN